MGQPSDPRVMCRDHGRMYDPAQDAGCAACRGEVEPTGQLEPEGGAPWGKLVVGVLAILVVATFFLGVNRSGSQSKSHEVVQLLANPYREEIEALEYILFSESSYGQTDAEQIVFLSRKLAAEMREWESHVHMLAQIAELRGFADQVEPGAGQEFGDADLFAARDAWQQLRDKIFEPEDWFLKE